jgi:hypothetical protein
MNDSLFLSVDDILETAVRLVTGNPHMSTALNETLYLAPFGENENLYDATAAINESLFIAVNTTLECDIQRYNKNLYYLFKVRCF